MARRIVSINRLSQPSTLPGFLSRIPCNDVSQADSALGLLYCEGQTKL